MPQPIFLHSSTGSGGGGWARLPENQEKARRNNKHDTNTNEVIDQWTCRRNNKKTFFSFFVFYGRPSQWRNATAGPE